MKHYNNLDCTSLFDDYKLYFAHIGTTTCENDADSEYNSNIADNNTSAFNKSRLELDPHSNMAVVGSSVYIISDSGKIADVNALSPDY